MARTTTDNTLTADALSARADQHRRAATSLAGQVSADDRAGKDIRPSALLVTRELGKAADLDRIAAALTTGTLTLTAPPTKFALPKTRTKALAQHKAQAKAQRAAEVEHAAEHDGDTAGDFPDADLGGPGEPLTEDDLTPDHDTNDANADGIIVDFDPDKD